MKNQVESCQGEVVSWGLVASVIMGLLVVASTSGCTGQRGWSVSFGIHPVSAINDNKAFKASDYDEKVQDMSSKSRY